MATTASRILVLTPREDLKRTSLHGSRSCHLTVFTYDDARCLLHMNPPQLQRITDREKYEAVIVECDADDQVKVLDALRSTMMGNGRGNPEWYYFRSPGLKDWDFLNPFSREENRKASAVTTDAIGLYGTCLVDTFFRVLLQGATVNLEDLFVSMVIEWRLLYTFDKHIVNFVIRQHDQEMSQHVVRNCTDQAVAFTQPGKTDGGEGPRYVIIDPEKAITPPTLFERRYFLLKDPDSTRLPLRWNKKKQEFECHLPVQPTMRAVASAITPDGPPTSTTPTSPAPASVTPVTKTASPEPHHCEHCALAAARYK